MKNLRYLIVSVLILLIGIIFLRKVDLVKTTERFFVGSLELFKSKSGMEVYTILFQKPQDECVRITNFTDQSVPYVDCCIWLEFYTCSKEFKRIVSRHQFETRNYLTKDTLAYNISFAPRPNWWKLRVLGDSLVKLSFKRDDKHEQIFFSNRDTTHVFCCDRAE